MKIKTVAANMALSVVSDAEQLSNAELIECCMQLGSLSVKARRMFMGLLPLVARRGAFDHKKFSSIYHFAAVAGGVGYGLVHEILRLDNQLEEFPKLRKVMYSGEIGWAKIRAVASLVTRENQEEWLELLRALSKPALEVYLRDFRKQEAEEHNLFSNIIETSCASKENILESSLPQKSTMFEAESFPGETFQSGNKNERSQDDGAIQENQISQKEKELSSKRQTFKTPINGWLMAQLKLFRRKLEKQKKRLITWEDVLMELLKRGAQS